MATGSKLIMGNVWPVDHTYGTCIWSFLCSYFDFENTFIIHITEHILSIDTFTIKQTWPKCGPWTFFVTLKSKLFNPIKTILNKKCTYFFTIIIKKIIFLCFAEIVSNFENCGPNWKIIFKFGPRAKKSLATPVYTP